MAKLPTLVIDIGHQRIKVAQVRASKGGVTVVKAGAESMMLPPTAEAEVVYQRIQETLPILLQRLGIREKRAVVTLPGKAAFSRRLKVPMVRGRQLDRIIKYEAKQHIPYPLEQVNIDYRVSEANGESAELEINLVAVRKEVSDAYHQALKKCGIQSDIIEAAPLCLYNAYAACAERDINEVTAVVSIGASSTDIIIEQNGAMQFMRSAPVAGNTLTALLAKRLEITPEKAEEVKLKSGEEFENLGQVVGDPNISGEVVSEILERGFESIVTEIRRSFDFYVSQPDALPVTRVCLCGGSVKIKGVTEFLGDRLGVPVKLFDAAQVQGVQIPNEQAEFLKNEAALMGMAVRIGGKAACALSFSPPHIKQRLEFERRAPMFSLMALLIVGILAVSIYFLQTMVDTRKQAVAQISDVIKPGQDSQPELLKGRTVMKNYDERFSRINEVATKRGFLTRVYLEVQRLIPQDIWLENIDISSGKLTIKGRAVNDEKISTYIQKLSTSPFFDNNAVVLKEANDISDSAAGLGQAQRAFTIQILKYNAPTDAEIKFFGELEKLVKGKTILALRFDREKPDDPQSPATLLVCLYKHEFETPQEQVMFISTVCTALLASGDESAKKMEFRLHNRNSEEKERYQITREQMLAYRDRKLSQDDFVKNFVQITPSPSPVPTATPTPSEEEGGTGMGAYGDLYGGGLEFSEEGSGAAPAAAGGAAPAGAAGAAKTGPAGAAKGGAAGGGANAGLEGI